MKLLFENWRKYSNEVNPGAQALKDRIRKHQNKKPKKARSGEEVAKALGYDVEDEENLDNIEESLYYGTSTIFQEEITKNGIKAPSEWGNYGLAEENAMKIVEKHGGEPMVIQMPRTEFGIDFLLDENNENGIMYTEDFFINLEKQEKTLM